MRKTTGDNLHVASQDPEQHHEQDPESSGCKSQFHGMLSGNHDCNGGEGSDD
ncbi:MAG: hypothetical protein ACPHP9_04865 [bacterium]